MPPPPDKLPPRRRTSTGTARATPARSVTGSSPSGGRQPVARLIVLAGPAAGQEFVLSGDEVVIGRGQDCAIFIADTAMSRKHALVRHVDQGWALSDLESGNGSLINGEAIVDETTLKHGDVIHLGDSELRYVGAAASRTPPAAEERSRGRGRPVRTSRMERNSTENKIRRRRALLVVVGTAAAIVALLSGWKVLDRERQEHVQRVTMSRQEHEAQMADLFKEAKALVRQGNWAQAQVKLLEMQQEDPDYEARQVENYLKTVEAEVPNQRLFYVAQEATKQGELGRAAEALAQVKTTIQESALAAARESLDARVDEALARGRELLAAPTDVSRMEALQALADDVLRARPEDRDAVELKRQAEAALNRLKNPVSAPVAPSTPWLTAQKAYHEGEVANALSTAEACAAKFSQCASMVEGIREFEAKLKRLDALSDAELGAMFELDRKLGGGTSSERSRPLRTQLASKLFLKASQAKTTGEWPKAIDLAKRVLRVDGAHSGARTIVSEGQGQARDMYIRGYQLQRNLDIDEAAKLYRDVIKMTPSDDESHQKAKARLLEIEKR